VGKPAGDSLSLIDLALADLAENMSEKREGEFTTSEIAQQTGQTVNKARYEASKMVAIGKWKVRRVDARTVFYRRA
jgi:hypothetical protein